MSVTSIGNKGLDFKVTLASTLTSIGQVQKIDAPGYKVGKRDITSLLSATKEYAPTITDPQEISGTLIWNSEDTTHQGILALLVTPAIVAMKLYLPGGTLFFGFNGFFTSFDVKAGDVEGTMMADFTVQVTGLITQPT